MLCGVPLAACQTMLAPWRHILSPASCSQGEWNHNLLALKPAFRQPSPEATLSKASTSAPPGPESLVLVQEPLYNPNPPAMTVNITKDLLNLLHGNESPPQPAPTPLPPLPATHPRQQVIPVDGAAGSAAVQEGQGASTIEGLTSAATPLAGPDVAASQAAVSSSRPSLYSMASGQYSGPMTYQ